LGGLKICLVGAKPTKTSCGDGTGYQQTSISKTVLPNHAKFTKLRATHFLVEMAFSMTANVFTPLNKGDFYETHIA